METSVKANSIAEQCSSDPTGWLQVTVWEMRPGGSQLREAAPEID